MPNHGKLGRLPADPSKPKLAFASLLREVDASQVPSQVDYLSAVPDWPMYGNADVGDCVEAGSLHALMAQTAYGLGELKTEPEGEGIKLYEAWTGYTPSDPNSDQGTVIQDALSKWRKSGIDGDKITAFASVDVKNASEIAAALYYFGHILIGLTVMQSAMDQFDAGEPWDVSSHPGDELGGHCVSVGYVDSKNSPEYKLVTWAAVQGMTAAFWDKYVEEAWVIVTTDWVNAVSGNTPTGMDLAAFGDEFATLTGEPNPFPTPEPVPTPVPPAPTPDPPGPTPEPTPTPEPGPDAADEALAPLLRKVLKHPFHYMTHDDKNNLRLWLADKGL